MAIKYVPYYPNTLEGQAVLDNFTRTRRVLRYRDNDKIVERIERGMPLYEMKLNEKVGSGNSDNMVVRGECLSACAWLKENNVKVDLVYIDPPFASGADYAKKIYVRRNPKVTEAIKQGEAVAVDDEELRMFEEKMYGDIWDKEKYLNWMYENLMAIKSVMSDTASIYVHLDWHIGHYVKILLDEIFGESNFKNEIVWGYRIQGVGKDFWARKHDCIYYYSKSDEYVFNAEKEDVIYEKPFMDTKRQEPDLSKLTDKERTEIKDCLDRNIPLRDKFKQMLFPKHYANVYVRDVWDCDMTKPIISGAKEYLDYKTQKPEGLLERIIKASSHEGMLVADFFGGSGVTAAVANRLGRRFIHCDIGVNSIETVRDRLANAGAEFDVMEIQDGVSLYRNPVQTMDKLKSLIQGLHKEDRLGKPWAGGINDSALGLIPVYLPNLMDSSSRMLDTALINRIIREAIPDLPDGTRKVIVYYIDITDRREIDNFIKENNETLVEIELRDLKQVLDCVVCEDHAEYELRETNNGIFKTWTVEIKRFLSDRVHRKIQEFNAKGLQQAPVGRKRTKVFVPITISEEGLETIEHVSLDCVNAQKESPWHSDAEIFIDKLGFVRINGEETKAFWDGSISSDIKPLRLKIRNICGDETVYLIDET